MQYRKKYHSTNNDFKELEILKLPDINIYFSQIFVYKTINGLSYPFDYFNFNSSLHNYNLRNINDLRPEFSRSLQGQSSPAIYCCNIWKELPEQIKTKPSVSSFKSALKRFLINQY